MQVGDENMGDPAPFNFVFGQLHLGTFTAVYKVGIILRLQNLGCWASPKCGQGRIVSEYGECEQLKVFRWLI
jgi:hypothetical protein